MHNEKAAVQVSSATLKANMVPDKVLSRYAAVAASKIKKMSNLKDAISRPENVCFRKSSRKLPHRTASAAAKKKLLSVYKEDDTTINSDSEKELEDINSKALFFRQFRSWKTKAQ